MNAPITATSTAVIVNSYDSGGYKIDEDTTNITFSVLCQLPCRTCSSTNNSICQTCYTNTAISTYIYFYSVLSACYQSCPALTYTSGFTCLNCNTQCNTCTGSATNCTSCVSNSSFPYLFINSSSGTCRNQCPTYYYPDTTSNPVLCILCVPPCSTCNSSSQCFSCVSLYYFYNNTCGTFCPTGTTLANNVTNNCDRCSTQCATCAGTVDTCITCSNSAAVYNFTCVTVCPGALVIYNGICSNCSTVCLTCYINYDNCTSCNTSSTLPYLYGSTCLFTCPELYYNSLADGLCKLCSTLNIGCNNCTSTSTCGTCNWAQGYVFLNNRCYLQTPNGYYNNTGYAMPCDSANYDCATCVNQSYNCTACVNKNL